MILQESKNHPYPNVTNPVCPQAIWGTRSVAEVGKARLRRSYEPLPV
ncbi:MAG: hypothetical protein ACR2NL_07200 [Acidimicrobiia bacterium]